MARSVFYGTGAFVGTLYGPTTCGFWFDEPDQLAWNQAALVPVDLSKNPESVRRGLITAAEVQTDDYAGYAFGGLNQIGPMFPGGRMTGACWLESNYWASLGTKQPPRVPPGAQARPYELTSVLYWDGALAGRRFNGVYGELRQVSGQRGLVALWERGASLVPNRPAFGVFWLDFQNDVLPPEPGFTEVGLVNLPRAGALFVDAKVLGATGLPMTKTPRAQGGVAAPRKRRR